MKRSSRELKTCLSPTRTATCAFPRRAFRCALGLLALALVGGSPGTPAASEPEGPLLGSGTQSIGLAGGWGVGFGLGAGHNTELEETRYSAFLPHWSIGLGGQLGRDRWYQGALELSVEGELLIQHEPKRGSLVGGKLLLRYLLANNGRVSPFLELGGGMASLDFDLDSQDDGFNFIPQGGVGLRWRAGQRALLTSGVRFHHISNAGLREPNHGINAVLFMIGMSRTLDF